MKPLLTRDAARRFDGRIVDAGVPGLLLMENAGRGAAELFLRRFAGRLARVVVVGGTGQNGGDAWVVARRLLTHGVRPEVFLAGSREKVGGDAKVNLEALDALGLRVTELTGDDLSALEGALESATAIVEGLFGTGLDRPIEGWRRALVERLDAASASIFALDLPSGIDADTGRVLGVALHAELTATFAGHKRGLWQTPGRAHAGETVCVDIGVPGPRVEDGLIELSDAARWLPPRALAAHKGTAGHLVVVAGSPGKSGAALLCGHGAMRAGAGLVTLAPRGEARDALELRVHELMTMALPDEPLELSDGKDAAVVGPGLGLDDAGKALAVQLATGLSIPAVLDADALTALAEEGASVLRSSPPRVLTPHPGEAARLLGCKSADVQADRYAAAKKLVSLTGQVVVLKGAGTLVAAPGKLVVCPFGTPALGVAGTGDVLAGAIGAALAGGVEPFEAACAMVLLHARAGERASLSDRGLFAREVADALPAALEEARAAGERR